MKPGPGVHVYPVGALADLIHFRGWWKHKGRIYALRRLAGDLKRQWRRRSYWNGFLAEVESLPYCGHGWTRQRAMRSLDRIAAGLCWARHDCGTTTFSSTAVRKPYCVTCDVKTARGWTYAPYDWDLSWQAEGGQG